MKLHLQKVTIEENLLNNSRSFIYLSCVTDTRFSSLTQNIAARNLLNEKVNYEKLEIYIELVCLGKDLVQSQDEEYMIPMFGKLGISKDENESLINERESFISLYAEINNHNWMKLKSDLLLVETKRFSFT
jgi:hypothetical protein